MIVLDSNVVSALMDIEREPDVRAWLRRQNPLDLALTAPTLFEVQYGIDLKPQGRRRQALEAALDAVLALIENRILPLDDRSAGFAANIRARQKRMGITAEIPDNLIAGIAQGFDARVATRNVADFREAGVTVINPWASQ